MPAAVSSPTLEALTVKVVSIFPENTKKGIPLIHAGVLLLDPDSSRSLALIEGSSLTALRTGAASGLATDLLARSESRVAAVIGAGGQARTQVAAICSVRPIEEVRIYARQPGHIEDIIREMATRSAREAVRGADIVCTATYSTKPVFPDASLEPGTHINAIGTYTPEMHEVPSETVLRAQVVVDQRDAALAEVGDLCVPIRAGIVGPEIFRAENGEMAAGIVPFERLSDEVTLFKSVGLGVQDTFAAARVYRNAHKMELGTEAVRDST
ncbi:ornithine cyclodeaminase family protein [Methanofollis aquaemaris]|uniref:Ornithine cyclodeaminase family protein n=2 Tax=Methanofollis aquaemaris TaxID=126734 RepID=A0A8A3S394_9EURY|nr:ornithine cyclodeaminase family protein [Methanofollis aquaemaris]